ncbi:peptide deformylase [Arthrobacter psychrolactophilus]|uniref:Peptide deformylase n=1 Tax=Arthrobacter psychrolactophilus TaxID=92442 RepID=A0A2V5JE06_9MICC|nr:peptide deformylase [Arthrobacter psychrolactophilus]PYI37547.1 peptide deformylase [Arthrobacter psychrolactophilus]
MSSTPLFDDANLKRIVASILDSDTLPAIVQAGHPVLRAQALPFSGQLSREELTALIALMTETMRAAPGVGLAAPQIGIPLQLAVLEDQYEVTEANALARAREPLELFAILNPRYTPVGTELASHYEGCLSMSGWQAVVDRPACVDLAYDDEYGTARTARFSGWQARIVQHETDHLSGTLYIDKAHTRSLASNVNYGDFWANPDIAAAKAGLSF